MKYMKQNKIYMFIVCLLTVFINFSCSNDDEESLNGQTVYVSTGVQPMSIEKWVVRQTPAGVSCEKENYKFPVKITAPLGSDLIVEMEYAPELIETYNAEHNTSYDVPVDNAINFSKRSVTIKAGQYESEDSISCSITNFSDLKSRNGYIIPLRLSKVSKGGVSLSSNLGVMYLALDVSWTNLEEGATSIEGEYCDRSAWTYVPLTFEFSSNPLKNAFDGKDDTYWEGYSYSGEVISAIDFGSKIKIKGFAIAPSYYTASNSTVKYPYNIKTVEILISDDGENWESQGIIDVPGVMVKPTISVIKFYAPVETRHVKLRVLKSYYPNSNDFYIGEINAVK